MMLPIFINKKMLSALILSSLLLIPLFSFAESEMNSIPFERTITKTFTVNNGSALLISNKYGKVDLHTWNKNQIQAVITIRADGNSSPDARQMADNVSIQTSQSGNKVSIITQYANKSVSSFWKRFFGGSGNNRRSVHIDYDVYLPRSLSDLQVQNSYGDVAGDDLPGNVSLKINYGHFYLSNMAKPVQVNADYATGTVTGVSNLSIQANYTDFNLDKINSLIIYSNYSTYKIEQAGNVRVQQDNYGDINAALVSSLHSSTTYSNYKIGTLAEGGNIQTTYGDVHIQSLGNQFSGLVIKPTYSNVYIGLPENMVVNVDINLTYGKIRTGNIPLDLKEKIQAHGKNILKAYTKGANGNAPVLQISGAYADVNLSGK